MKTRTMFGVAIAAFLGLSACGTDGTEDPVEMASCRPEEISVAVLCVAADGRPSVNARGRDVFSCRRHSGASVAACRIDYLTFVRDDGSRVEFECGECPAPVGCGAVRSTCVGGTTCVAGACVRP